MRGKRKLVYLDHAATARYLPVSVIKEYVKVVSAKCNPGRGSYRDAVDLGLKVYRVRESIKRYLNAPRHEVVFCKNCTEALNLALLGLGLEGRVVTTVTEHNSVLRPLHHLAKEGKISYVTVSPSSPDKGVDAAAIERALTPDTSLVVVNLVSNVTGVANDLPAIGAMLSGRGVPLLVDGAQGVGHMAIDVASWGIDMLACPAHKGLHGLSGGFLLTNRTRLSPLLYGGTGTASHLLTQPAGVDGWEAGTQDYAGICALGKGVQWTYEHLNAIIAHEEELIDYLAERLDTLPFVQIYGRGHGILSFAMEGLPSTTVGDRLDEMGVAVRVGLHCAPLMHRYLGTTKEGLVRVSVGWDTTRRDVDRLLAALAVIARQ